MTVRLRGHHLLCLLTYAGRGYTPAFVSRLDQVADRIAAGATIEIVAGPDEVCAAWLDDPDCHCGLSRMDTRDRLALDAVGPLLGVTLGPGARLTLTPDSLAALREAFAAGSVRAACFDCRWRSFCTDVAANGFAGTRLTTVRPPF